MLSENDVSAKQCHETDVAALSDPELEADLDVD